MTARHATAETSPTGRDARRDARRRGAPGPDDDDHRPDLPGRHRRGLGREGLPGARRRPPPARRDDPPDLAGVTARLTPPLDPRTNLGYFEYGENSFADLQGEDTDDYLRFTAKAPEGQLFTGRVCVRRPLAIRAPTSPAQAYVATQPITITSQYAEIIYFLRNGNLYRRVLLVAPERQQSSRPTFSGGTPRASRRRLFGGGTDPRELAGGERPLGPPVAPRRPAVDTRSSSTRSAT